MSLTSNIRACQDCTRHAGQRCHGKCPCPADGQDISRHALAGECPRGLYRWRGLGDLVAALIRRMGLGQIWTRLNRTTAPSGPQGCGGCKQRQAALNRLLPFPGEADRPAVKG